ncbi:MAG: hypothetical protein J6C15_02800 [Bacteroidaceae bacterium]|nr:hypothetical protein [Bacteroidaceae bacterium]
MNRFTLGILLLLFFVACNPEDRSGEQPFAPTVRTLTAVVEDGQCLLTGCIDASPNSRVLKRGFRCGNDTLRLDILSEDEVDMFHAYVEGLLPGEYFAVAYATNGVGTSLGDTLFFFIPKQEEMQVE